MGGTWLDWVIVLIGCIVLLPRLFAYAINTSLVRYAQRKASEAGLELECALGSISFRAIKDIRIRMGRWRLPQHPNLYASIEISVESICWQLFKQKPITASLLGARFLVRLSPETPAEKIEREQELLQQPSSASLASGVVAEDASKPSWDRQSSPFKRAELSTRNLHALESSVVMVTSKAAQNTNVSFWPRFCEKCALKIVDWVAISIQRMEVTMQRGDVQVSVCDFGINLYVGTGSTHTARQLHVDLLGLAVRLEQVSTQTAFRTSSAYNPMNEKWRMPPILQILPTDIAIDMEIQRCTPVGIPGIEIGCKGIELTIDPDLLLPAVSQMTVEFAEQIKAFCDNILPTEPAPTPSTTSSATPTFPAFPATPAATQSTIPSRSQASPLSTSSSSSLLPSIPPTPASLPNGAFHSALHSFSAQKASAEYSAEKRQFWLRFMPKGVKLVCEHLKLEVLQRDSTVEGKENVQAQRASENDLRKRSIAAGPIGMVLPMNLCPKGAWCIGGEVGADGAYTPWPILNVCLLRFNKLAVLSSVKTAYPVWDVSSTEQTQSVLTPVEDNHISSVDWSVNMAGPSIWFSQQGMVYPRLDVEYCKFTGHSSANFAAAATPAGVNGAHMMHSKHAFPLAAPMHASAGAFSTSLNTGFGGASTTSQQPNAATSRRPKRASETGSGKKGNIPTVTTSFHPVNSLFHPTTAYRPQTVHALTFVCVSLRVHAFPSSAEWVGYGADVAERIKALAETLPIPKKTPGASEDASNGVLSPTISSTFSPSDAPASKKSFSSEVTSPASYLRQINLAGSGRGGSLSIPQGGAGGGGMHGAAGGVGGASSFPQFPFSSGSQATSPNSSPFPSYSTSTPSAILASVHKLEGEAEDPYEVRSAVTINVKVVDLHLAIYPKAADTLPLLHASISEISLRYDVKPSTATVMPPSAPRGSLSGDAAPSQERIEVIVSGFVASMPRELHNPHALTCHPSESLRVPGRFWQLHSATLLVDQSARELMFTADGLTIRYTTSVLLLGPPLLGLLIAHLPPSPPSSGPPTPPIDKHLLDLPIKIVRGTITNVCVDFPYVLEFKSDEKKRKTSASLTTPSAKEAVGAQPNSARLDVPSGSSILEILSPSTHARSLPTRKEPSPDVLQSARPLPSQESQPSTGAVGHPGRGRVGYSNALWI